MTQQFDFLQLCKHCVVHLSANPPFVSPSRGNISFSVQYNFTKLTEHFYIVVQNKIVFNSGHVGQISALWKPAVADIGGFPIIIWNIDYWMHFTCRIH